ncbi:MAG: tRNA (N6-isopentenyl adenosine(37)-C2)-methylthiotransferase MiaB [Dongiaceae bacterium]
MAKKLLIKTYGCQMNVYDSARMADVMAPLGYARTDSPAEADMVILNTCHIREKAAEKLYSDLGRLRPVKLQRQSEGSGMIVAVAGCVAQAEGAEIMRRAPVVDIVLGPQTYHRLPEMVARAVRATAVGHGERNATILDTSFPPESKFDYLPESAAPQGLTAFLSIQEGCDKFCTFCVVPYTRGAEYSRPAAGILAEARRLVAAGAREITMLGQNVNAYQGPAPSTARAVASNWGLARLIRALAEIDGLARIRYTTSHPRDMGDELIDAHGDVPKLMPYLHLPVQSGSDRILHAMNRQHGVDDYRRIVERLRRQRPDIAMSSDFIVGFPGESDGDFEATLDLVAEIGFAQAYSFMYSARPGTPAATMPDQVAPELKAERLERLQTLLRQQQLDCNRKMIGQTVPVLFDRTGRHDGQLIGRSPYMQSVHARADATAFGRIIDVTIEGVGPNSLAGRLADPARRSATSRGDAVMFHEASA